MSSLTAETMSRHISAQVLDVEAGVSRPKSIRLRLMLPAPDIRLALPRAKDDPSDERPAATAPGADRTHVGTLRDDLYRLRTVGLVPEVSVEIRSVPLTPSSCRS